VACRSSNENKLIIRSYKLIKNKMDNKTEEKKEARFVCRSCGSESKGTPGTCCGGKPREKVCTTCGHLHKEDKSCDCGCKM
jgi:hypothetical protein